MFPLLSTFCTFKFYGECLWCIRVSSVCERAGNRVKGRDSVKATLAYHFSDDADTGD